MQWTGEEAQSGQEHADEHNQPNHDQADRIATRLPDAQVTHGLKADGIEGGCEGREVVGDEEDFDDHSCAKNEYTEDEEANAAIEEDSPDHEQRRKQRKTGIKLETANDLDQCLWKKPARL